MNISQNKCPKCGKRAGLISVGPDFDHVIDEWWTSETLITPTESVVNGVKRVSMVVSENKVKKQITLKGPGSKCELCSWSRRDILSVHYSASCVDCKEVLGTHSHLEGESPKKHVCPKCSKKRVDNKKHDPDDAVVTYTIMCAGGCGKKQVYLSWSEGDVDRLPHGADKEYFCTDQKCLNVMNINLIDKIAAAVAAGAVQ